MASTSAVFHPPKGSMPDSSFSHASHPNHSTVDSTCSYTLLMSWTFHSYHMGHHVCPGDTTCLPWSSPPTEETDELMGWARAPGSLSLPSTVTFYSPVSSQADHTSTSNYTHSSPRAHLQLWFALARLSHTMLCFPFLSAHGHSDLLFALPARPATARSVGFMFGLLVALLIRAV